MHRFTFYTTRIILAAAFALAFTACSEEEVTPATVSTDLTVVQLLSNDLTNDSLLVAAVVRAGLDDDLAAATANGFTVFAPTNAAMSTAGLNTKRKISFANVDSLANILRYHLLGTSYETSEFSEAIDYTTLQGSTLAVDSTRTGSTINFFVNQATTNATVSTRNIRGSNGVIHYINKVLVVPSVAKK